jgi:hypothetical protein
MKTPLTKIADMLNAAPRGITVIDGTTFTLLGDPEPFPRNIKPFPAERKPGDPRSDHSRALELYGTEERAAAEIRRQLATMGDDVDPATRKRAEKLADQMEAGYTLTPEYYTRYDAKAKRHVSTGEIRHYQPNGLTDKKILGEALGRSEGDIRWGNLSMSENDIETLRNKGFTIRIYQ